MNTAAALLTFVFLVTPRVEDYVSGPMEAVTFIVSTNGNPSLKSISLSTIRKIYDCTLRNWKDVPGSDRTDAILPFAPYEKNEATQFLQKRIPKFKLGRCVTTVSGPDPSRALYYAIGEVPPNKIGAKEMYNAIAYLNHGQRRAGQKPLAISDDLNKKKGRAPIAPTEQSVKSRAYPLTR